MADLGITWLLELINKVSGPAKEAEGDLKHLQSTFEKLHETMKLVDGGFLQAGVAAGATGAALSVLGSGLEGLVDIGKEAVAAVFEIGKSFAEASIEAASFEESTRTVLRNVMPTEEIAEKTLQDAKRLADMTQLTTQAVVASTRAFAIAGFNPEEIKSLNLASADIAGLNPDNQGATQVFSRHIAEIMSGGASLRSLTMLQRELHIPRAALLKNIGEAFNLKPEEVEKHFKSLDGRTVVAGIVKTIAGMQKGGQLGGLTLQASRDVEGLFSTLKSRPQAILGSLSLEGGFEKFRGFLLNLTALTNPESGMGKKIVDGLHAIFNGAATAIFGPLSGEEGARHLETVLQNLLTAFSYIGAAAAGMFSGIEGLLEGLLGTSDDLFGDGPLSEAQIKMISETMRDFGTTAGTAVRGLIDVFKELAGLAERLSAGILAVGNAASNGLLGQVATSILSATSGNAGAGVGTNSAIAAGALAAGSTTVNNHIETHVDARGQANHEVGALVGEHTRDQLLKFLEQKGTTTGGVRTGRQP